MVEVVIAGKRYELRGRLADMIIWLVQREATIRRGAGRVTFRYHGSSLSATIEEEEVISK